MELNSLCRLLEKSFPLEFAKKYEPLSFIFPAVNKEAGIDVRSLYEKKFFDMYNGLMVRGYESVNRVFCVVFPDRMALERILAKSGPGDFIFTHHCCGYDKKKGFVPIPGELVRELKDNGLSLYSLHVPFDVNSRWSTSVQLADAMGVNREGEFAVVFDKPTGVYGKPAAGNLHSLAEMLRKVTGVPEVTVIANRKDQGVNRVAVIAGGGGYANLVNDAHQFGCDTFLTGTVIEEVEIDVVREANLRFRQKAEELGINLIGGGHYYTEKIAVEGMVEFFENSGIKGEFIPSDMEEQN